MLFLAPAAGMLAASAHAQSAGPKVLTGSTESFVLVPPGRYVVREPIEILEGQVWQFQNSVIERAGPGPAFVARRGNWVMQGHAKFDGNPRAVGLMIDRSLNYLVSDMRFAGFGAAVQITDRKEVHDLPRGARGKFTDVTAISCGIGFNVGPGAEYCTFTSVSAVGCQRGVVVAGGSTQFVGGNLVDCQVAIELTGGINHAHGGFHGVNVNHSVRHAILAQGIRTGHTFSGCHFYGDGPDRGTILLRDCSGINISGGQLDCAVIAEGGQGNLVADNVIAGANFKVVGGVACRDNTRLDGSDACPG
jgi:hypothetical protein